MSSNVTTTTRIPLSNVVPVDMSKLRPINIVEATDPLYDRFVEAMESMLKASHTEMPDLSGHPAYQPYAKVVGKDGKVIAEIDNNGFVTSSNAVGAQLRGGMPGDVNGETGPVLAQARAEYIAGQMGGKIVMAETAMSQGQYKAAPKPQGVVDDDAMRQDPLYLQLQNAKQARTLFLAQQLGRIDRQAMEQENA